MNALYAQTHPVQWECQAVTQDNEGRGQQAMDGQPRCRDSLHSVTTSHFSIFVQHLINSMIEMFFSCDVLS